MLKNGMKNKIHFIITGGTIDSFYNPPTESGKPLKESVIPGYIEDAIRPHRGVTFETICMKDSGDITAADRQKILKAVQKAKTNHVVITHGTVTMEITADFLKKNLKHNEKTVVLTGAMTPLKQFAMSDGGFNVGFAVATALNEKPGVHICMHAEVFPAGKATKNKKDARFVYK
jgi:L-asparaginase